MPQPTDPRPPEDRVVAKLQAVIRHATVSHTDWSQVDTEAFDALLAELEAQFPRLHSELELTRIKSHGLLFRWPGASDERPVVLMAHLDVVPIDADAPWQHPPFGAEIHDGAIWGRGTLDDKGCVVAVCEAVERLLERGFSPAQDVWLSFGCDEEVFGGAARETVEELERRAVRPWFVVDEGGAVAGGAFPGVSAPVAVIGVAEKGTTGIELVCEGRGGHASQPARKGPTWRIARAIMRIERSPFPASLPEPAAELMRRMAPHASPALRPVLAGSDRVRPLLTRALVAAGPESAAMTRTTVAATTLSGSPGHNVIATTARAGLNVRIMPGETVDSVVAHLRKAIRDDRVAIHVTEHGEPSPVSPYDGDEAFDLLAATVADHFPDAVVAPYVLMAATDSRYFTRITDRVYRFAPFRMSKAQREAIHSYDEHIGVDDFVAGVAWYEDLIERIR